MKKHGKTIFFAWPGVLLALVCTAAPLAAAAPEASDTCGNCHRDIYRMWRDSAHAQAVEDPFFLEPLGGVEARYGAGKTATCLGCHAPMAALVNDRSLAKAISREGVNCEFCHGLVEVELGERGPRHVLDIGPVKRGTIPGAESRGHDVAYSELHSDSRVCAPCHEYVSDAGIPVMTTYSEWRSSAAAERGETCQSCHMSLVDSDVVDPRIKRDSGAKVNLHEMPGGHSLEQLHKALRVHLAPERGDGSLEIKASIKNLGAGHAVPTGMPGRRIILHVAVRTSDGEAFEDTRVYEKRYVDANDERVEHVADLFFARGLKLARDSRIGADETREETFVFPVSADASAWINLKLQYEHAPWGKSQDRVWITFLSESRFIRRS